MSNIKRTDQADPLTYTVDAGALTTTHGKMAVTKAAETTIGTDARGTTAPAAAPAAAGAHFHLVTFGATKRPPRYIDVIHKATGSSAGDTDALVFVEFYDAGLASWVASEPFRACGRTVIAAAAAADPAEYLSEIHTVKVPRAAIAGRFYITGLAANTGLDLIVNADNDD